MNDRVIFLQARMGSTRLPGKVLMPLGGKAIVTLAMEALNFLPADERVLLVDHESYEKLAPYAAASGFGCFAGSGPDVLGRFAAALEKHPAKTLIRATADNPLVSWELAGELITEQQMLSADYACHAGIPHGSGVEIVNASALLTAAHEAESDYEREHVCPFLYQRPERFLLHRPLAPADFQSRCRVTVDTIDDYTTLSALFNELYKGKPLPLRAAIAWFEHKGRTE